MSAFSDLIGNIFGTVAGKIPVRGTLTTPSGVETFPIAICNEIMGGPFIVNSVSEMETIPLERLLEGCKCTVNEYDTNGVVTPTTTYQLRQLPTLSNYTLITPQDGSAPYYKLNDISEFWILDRPLQELSTTVEYQYSDNYNNQRPLFAATEITKDAYQAGYATTSGYNNSDINQLIWTGTYDTAVHKWSRQKTGAQGLWGIPVSLSQNYVAGDYIDVRFIWELTTAGIPLTPPSMRSDGLPNNEPIGWSDVPDVPLGEDYTAYIQTHSLWKISATKDTYGDLKSVWSKPLLISTDPNLVRYGQDYKASLEDSNVDFQNGTYWHFFYEPGDVFKASRPNTSSAWTIEKIEGESGEYTDYVFKEFIVGRSPRPEEDPTAAPTTLLGYGVDGWQDAVFTPQTGYDIYVSTCRKYSNNTQATPWSYPAKYNGDSTVRAIITPAGETTFKYTVLNGQQTITPATIVLNITMYDGSTLVSSGDLSGIQWFKGNSLINGNSTTSLTVAPGDIDGVQVYRIKATYRGQVYEDQITLQDSTDGIGYIVSIYSSTGFTYKGTAPKTFEARVYENGRDKTNELASTLVWKLNNIVQTTNVSVDKKSVTIQATSVVGIGTLELSAAALGTTYKCAETLTDVVDGVSLVRYYSPTEAAPAQPTNGTATPAAPWTTDSTNAVWVVERPSNSTTWNPLYRIKGEKGVPNGGFQKTIYLKQSSSLPVPSAPVAVTSGALNPSPWTNTPPSEILADETTYGTQAMFFKNPNNENTSEIAENWNIVLPGWSTPFKLTTSFVGGAGPAGANGTNGYIPQYKLYPYLEGTILLNLFKWIDSTGADVPSAQAPATGFLTPTGLSSSPLLAGNIRGGKGDKGNDAISGTRLSIHARGYSGKDFTKIYPNSSFLYSYNVTRNPNGTGSFYIALTRTDFITKLISPDDLLVTAHVNFGRYAVGTVAVCYINKYISSDSNSIIIHITTADDTSTNTVPVDVYIYEILTAPAKVIL